MRNNIEGISIDNNLKQIVYIYVRLKDRKRLLSEKNSHNALWLLRKTTTRSERLLMETRHEKQVVTCQQTPVEFVFILECHFRV